MLFSVPQQQDLFQSGASRRTVARSVTCRYCQASCLVAVCFDGRWRLFDRIHHTGPAAGTGARWWLTRGVGMVHDGIADGCPARWVAQHFCRDSAEAIGGLFTGIVPGLDPDDGGSE